MNKKPFIILIILSLLLLSGCVPEQYRVSIGPDENFPENDFPFYKPSVVFEYTGGTVMRARAGVKEEAADIIGHYRQRLDGAYFIETSATMLEGFYKEYLFRIETQQPSEEEGKVFGQVYTVSIEKLSADFSAAYSLPQGYPEELFPVYDGARIYESGLDGGDFVLTAGTDDGLDAVLLYYDKLLGDAVLDERSQDGGQVISGYLDGYLFTFHIRMAQADEARAYTTIIKTIVQNAAIDFGSPPQQAWGLALSMQGDYDISAMERVKSGYVLAGTLHNDAWIVKIDADGAIGWENVFGGSGFDAVNAVLPTDDGGVLAVGITNSRDGGVSGVHEGTLNKKPTHDVWLIKLSAAGQIEWQKVYGGSANDYGMGAVKADGGYVIMATTGSEDGDVSGWHKGYSKSYPTDDIWVLMVDAQGELLWQRALGGTGDDRPGKIIATDKGELIVCGATWSQDGDVLRNDSTDASRDIWAVKLSAEGELLWQRALGGRREDIFDSVQVAGDGSIHIAGSTRSNDGDVQSAKGSSDYWAVKLSAEGDLLWNNALGGSGFDYLHGMHLDEDGSMLVTGWSYSADGDKSRSFGDADIWTAKLSPDGVLSWEKTLGGSRFESVLDIFSAGEVYVVAGYTSSVDGDVAGRTDNEYATPTYDYWLAGLDQSGNLLWQQAYGGSANEHLDRVLKTPDGGYLLAGISYSAENEGAEDAEIPYYWVLKLKHGYAAAD